MSDFLWSHGLQHTRFPCPSPSPRVSSSSCPLYRWCHPTISSSVQTHQFYWFLFSLHCSLRKAFLSLLAILWNCAFRWVCLSFSPLPFTCLFFSAIYKVSSDSCFVFLHFFISGMVLITTFCTMLWTSSILAQIAQRHLSGKGRIDGIRSMQQQGCT